METIRLVKALEKTFNVDVAGLDDVSKAKNCVLSYLLFSSRDIFPISRSWFFKIFDILRRILDNAVGMHLIEASVNLR